MKLPMVSGNVCALIGSHAFGILYVLLVLALWSVAMWDISMIVNEFLFDNRFTLVRRVDVVNNTAPFVEDVEVCVTYDTNIFNLIWWNDTEVKGIMEELENVYTPGKKFPNWTKTLGALHGKNFSTNKNGTIILTREELIYVAKIMDQIYEMESNYRTTPKDITDYYYNKFPVELFLNNSQATLLAKSVHKWIESHTSALPPFFGLKSFLDRRICSYVQTQYILNGTSPNLGESGLQTNMKLALPIGIFWSYANGKPDAPFESKVSSVEVRLPNQEHYIYDIPAGHSGVFTIEISNVGMYDKREVSNDCIGNGEISQIGNQNCKNVLYLKSMKSFCKCVPFSNDVCNVGRSDGFSDDREYPFCSREIYNSSCMHRVADFLSISKCPDYCVATKNKYLVSKEIPTNTGLYWADIRRGAFEQKYSRVGVVLVMMDTVYSVYEEKYKMSVSQLIAQVGGDLGLYTGFSMLALCQFLSFLITHHRSQHKVKKDEKQQHQPESWFQVLVCSFTNKCGESKIREREEKARIERETKFSHDLGMRLNQIDEQIMELIDQQKSTRDLIQKLLPN